MSAALFDTSAEFTGRHIGSDAAATARMLEVIGLSSLDELLDVAVPDAIRVGRPLDLPSALSEAEALREIEARAADNRVMRSFIGMGYHGCLLPSVIRRSILENPGWYTQYTPYQAEISQGRLEALLNFQTMISDLTGLDVANASLLDEATAAAEAMGMSFAVSRRRRGRVFLVSSECHPQTIAVVQTRARSQGIEVRISGEMSLDDDVFGILLQYPGTTGHISDPSAICRQAREAGIVVTMVADLLALAVLRSPGDLGADVAVGSAQRFGVPMGFGGPHAAYFATREAHKRKMPGRVVGVSRDSTGRPALRLALQSREQHIRRESATSNICTSQVLLAIIASTYAVYHGPDGIRRIARRVRSLAESLAALLERGGRRVAAGPRFDTVCVDCDDAERIMAGARAQGMNLRRVDDTRVSVSFDETHSPADVEALLEVFGVEVPLELVEPPLPPGLSRDTPILEHSVFNRYHSEHELLRYLCRLQTRDLSLTTSMIPLGSCTMKLNAAAEMLPITLPGFAGMHPFAPEDQSRGFRRMIGELEAMLAEITGLSAVSLQPNAGSQGEYTGLLVIRRYLGELGQHGRDICLIPGSAHGTNPASAVMAGMKVQVVRCDERGNIDMDDLAEQVQKHADRLAALMVTYPSTHGVFEASIVEICRLVHGAGGQVYMDGANMNAQVGVCRPGDFGVDVCHLNLHKTFCIPHGGGGPGVGPIAVADHLAPFLPGHPVVDMGTSGGGAVSAAPWGSAGILPISWMFIRMMGAEGLLRATQAAILHANYLASRLAPHFPILYTGESGWVAHEFIIDLRPLRKTSGISVADVAKRLMDYGFHAPTISWPVAGTMMIEPTESESQTEMDRFADALIAIRREIGQVESGEFPQNDNPLVNAPHSAVALAADPWSHPYSRETAAFPAEHIREHKYWAPVCRIDDAYGDRNLVCSCPPLEAYGAAPDS